MNRSKDYLETNETRVRSLKKALKIIKQAWELYDKDDLKRRSVARLYIAKIHMELGEYDEAIPHLTVIYNATKSRKVSKDRSHKILILGLLLGLAYLKERLYQECEKIFREIIREGESLEQILVEGMLTKQCKGIVVNEILKYGIYSVSLGKVMACAHIGRAFSYIGRDISVNIKDALAEVQTAEIYSNLLINEDEKTLCQADAADCKGRILYKQDLFWNKGTIEDAIECLERSISYKPTSRAYLHLSLAYEHKSKKTKDEKEKETLIAMARSYCRHAQDIDLKKEYKAELEELNKRLEIRKSEKLWP